MFLFVSPFTPTSIPTRGDMALHNQRTLVVSGVAPEQLADALDVLRRQWMGLRARRAKVGEGVCGCGWPLLQDGTCVRVGEHWSTSCREYWSTHRKRVRTHPSWGRGGGASNTIARGHIAEVRRAYRQMTAPQGH